MTKDKQLRECSRMVEVLYQRYNECADLVRKWSTHSEREESITQIMNLSSVMREIEEEISSIEDFRLALMFNDNSYVMEA